MPSNNNAATVLKVPTVSVTEASGGTVASPATVTNTSDSGEAAGGETGTMDECSDGWITEEELDGEEGLRADCGGGALMGSMDSVTTGSSCCSSPTPRSSPKRSPLLKNVSYMLVSHSPIVYSNHAMVPCAADETPADASPASQTL